MAINAEPLAAGEPDEALSDLERDRDRTVSHQALELFPLLARIAALLTQPIRYSHPSQLEALRINQDSLQALISHPSFRRRLEGAAFRQLRADGLEPSEESLARIREPGHSQLAAAIVGAGPDDLTLAAQILAAVIMQQPLCALVTKLDRKDAISHFGEQAFQIAVREAALMYGELTRLRGEWISGEYEQEDGFPVLELGLGALYGFVAATEPGLAGLLALRLPADVSLPDPGLFDARLRSLIARLLCRKITGWAQCIG